MTKWTFLFSSFLLTVSAAFASELQVCELRPISSESLKGRGTQINFPDGTNIQIVGHYHGSRDSQRRVMNILSEPTVSDSEVANKTRPILEDAQTAVEEFNADINYIKAYLQVQHGEVTLWAEGSEYGINQLKSQFQKVFMIRANHAGMLNDQLLFASASPVVYAAIATQLPHNVKTQGVETLTPNIRSMRLAAEDYSRRASELAKGFPNFKLTDDLISNMRSEVSRWNEALNSGDSEFLSSYDIRRLYSIIDAEKIPLNVKMGLKYQLTAELLNYRSYAERNELNAKRLLDSQRSGILFIGSSHVIPIINILRNKCMEKLNSTETLSTVVQPQESRTLR